MNSKQYCGSVIILKFVQFFGLDRIIFLGYTRNLLPGKTQVMLACSAGKKAASGTFLEFKIINRLHHCCLWAKLDYLEMNKIYLTFLRF